MNFEWLEADLENWEKNKRKSKDLEKLINSYIITQREKDRYLEIFGKLPEEFPDGSEGQLEWDYPKTKESREYVKKLTETNPTSTAKFPGRKSAKIHPPVRKEPGRPPKH
jgi:hypothetical protein